jgi:catechol 2,3-dioxygenase-like lactoylglutathione lyase family enzyme
MNRISIICFGVRNMEASIRFYRDGLGFQTNEKENDLDGYYWEVAYNPYASFDENDMLVI